MPAPTIPTSWPAKRPDFWAGERGGRPLPKQAPLPKRGDGLPQERKLTLVMRFREHDKAVDYARTFGKHVQIHTEVTYDSDGAPTKWFVVNPRFGRVTQQRDKYGNKRYSPKREG